MNARKSPTRGHGPCERPGVDGAASRSTAGTERPEVVGAICTHQGTIRVVPKVIQIRDVPDEIRDALAEAAAAEGLSLATYVRRELEHLASRAQRVRENAAVIRQAQTQVRSNVDRETILSTLHEGRGD